MPKYYKDMWLTWDYKNEHYLVLNEDTLEVEATIAPEDLKPSLYMIDFGKHDGKTLVDVYIIDPEYITWMLSDSDSQLLKQCVKNL